MDQSHASTDRDETLMRSFQRRKDHAALHQLVDRYGPRGLAVARQLLPDASLAEDAVQEAFIRLIRAHDSYDPARVFSTWFFTILRNVCKDMLRKLCRESRALQASAAGATISCEPPELVDPGAAAILAELPPPIRRAVSLRVIDGLAFADVAAALGISEDAAKKRVQRGLRALRESVAARSISEAADWM